MAHTLRIQVLLAALAALLAALTLGALNAPVAHAKADCPGAGKSPNQLRSGQARDAVLCLVNKQRRHHDLGRLHRDRKLQRAAMRHNRVMVSKRCFSHQCSGEPSLEGRLRQVSYLRSGLSRYAYSENIAWGGGELGTAFKIVKAWMHSPPHRAAILSRTYREAGIGFHDKAPGRVGYSAGTYTIDFGLARG
ncbi:MAG: CAP domain-containing protein [Solirubrobacterales bacterium]|nr:CAP domain-containing protein [Solirubrobacterales bacterium]